ADAGEAAALTRLASLLTDPGLRAGMGPTALLRYYADHWRSGDAAVVRHALEHSHPGAWQVISAWVGEEMRVVRRVDGCPVALVAALPLASANRISGPRRQLIAPVVEHA